MHLYSTNLSHINNDILLSFTFDISIIKSNLKLVCLASRDYLKDSLKKCVFRSFLNLPNFSASLIWFGS